MVNFISIIIGQVIPSSLQEKWLLFFAKLCSSMTKWGSLQYNWFLSYRQKYEPRSKFFSVILPKYSTCQTQSWQTLFSMNMWKERGAKEHLLLDWSIEVHISYIQSLRAKINVKLFSIISYIQCSTSINFWWLSQRNHFASKCVENISWI